MRPGEGESSCHGDDDQGQSHRGLGGMAPVTDHGRFEDVSGRRGRVNDALSSDLRGLRGVQHGGDQ